MMSKNIQFRASSFFQVSFVAAAILIFASGTSASATNVFLSQSGGGSGTSCSDTLPVSWFNSSANWGSGSAQIGPGTTVHLCGTISGTAGATGLTAQGSGASGNPITILFESGANMTAPYWAVAIKLNGVSWIVVNGGLNTPCGYTPAVGSEGACNGIIQNTANGSAGTMCPSGNNCQYQQNSQALLMQPCSNCEVKNLGVINLYMHNVATDEAADQNFINAVNTYGSGTTIDHNSFHDIGWAIQCAHSNITVNNNDISRMDHGFAIGAATNETVTGIVIHDNHWHDMANWDDNANQYHHDGIHIWAQTSNDQVTGVLIYNNRFDGDSGNNLTGWDWAETSVNNMTRFNNVYVMDTAHSRYSNVGVSSWSGEGTTMIGNASYNETILGANYHNGGCLGGTYLGNVSVMNSVLVGCSTGMGFGNNTSISPNGINNNVYENVEADAGDSNGFNFDGPFVSTLSAWRALLPAGSGQDANAKMGTLAQINLNSSTGLPQSNSIAAGSGQNLASLCIQNGGSKPNALCSDINGNPRPGPGQGAWDAGAYQFSGATASQPPAPTNLTATVQAAQ
jgi:hypothetical protein